MSAWSGIRPLVSDPNKPDTQSLARNHIVHVSPSGLVTIAGGKWTTYRSMASETIDAAIESKSQTNLQNTFFNIFFFRCLFEPETRKLSNRHDATSRGAWLDANDVHSFGARFWTRM